MPRLSRFYTLLLVMFTAGVSFDALAFERALREAGPLLERGEADAALGVLKEAQIDDPNAPELRFGIACAQYVKGEGLLNSGAPEEAAAAFQEARALFSSLAREDREEIAREATFNGANVLARQALARADGDDYPAAVAALREAVTAFEAGLERFPEHPGIRQNLDHLRYRLKELLQNPPPKQEQPEQEPPPPDQQPDIMSRFGHVTTELPGAQTRLEENTAVLVPPEAPEAQP